MKKTFDDRGAFQTKTASDIWSIIKSNKNYTIAQKVERRIDTLEIK